MPSKDTIFFGKNGKLTSTKSNRIKKLQLAAAQTYNSIFILRFILLLNSNKLALYGK